MNPALSVSVSEPEPLLKHASQRLKIAEIFQSRQGEGLLTGTESVFIRTSGCNLRCGFCDTPYASWQPEGPAMTPEEILRDVRRFSARHVVITGGEPMLFPQLGPLTRTLADWDYHITIETAGTVYQPVICHLMSISPKLSNSRPDPVLHPRWAKAHECRRYRPEILRRLIQEHTYQLKFVIDQPADVQEVEGYLREIPEIQRERVLLMPQGTELAELQEKARWLEPLCRDKGFVFCPRKHIEWYGSRRGT